MADLGARGTAPASRPSPLRRRAEPPACRPATGLVLATWKQLLDNGSMQDGDDAPGRAPPARRSRGSRATVADAVGPDGRR